MKYDTRVTSNNGYSDCICVCIAKYIQTFLIAKGFLVIFQNIENLVTLFTCSLVKNKEPNGIYMSLN